MQLAKKISILLVDDSQNNLIALEAALHELGQQVISVTSGEAALAYVLKQEFAVILLDLQMPGMDGLQTARFIRETPGSHATPIIFMSTFHNEEDMVAVYKLGAVDYLLKPIMTEILTAKVSVFVELFSKNQELLLKNEQQESAFHRQQRLAFLSEASNILASSLDYQATLGTVAHLCVPHLADWCLVDLIEEDGKIARVAIAHKEPAKEVWLRELEQKYPLDPQAQYGVAEVLRTGESIIAPKILDEQLVKAARDEEHLRLMRELGLKSTMIVPLGNRQHHTGAITFVLVEAGRHYGSEDLAFAEDLAYRASLAIENARLYRKTQTALEMHRTIEDQLMLLTEAAGYLISSIKLNELLPAILALSRRLIAADAYAVWRYYPHEHRWQIACAAGLSEAYQQTTVKTMTTPAVQEQPYIFEDVDNVEMIADRRELYRAEGIRSLLSVPLTIQGDCSGTITFYYHQKHNFNEVEVRLATALANIAAAAISTAELYENSSKR